MAFLWLSNPQLTEFFFFLLFTEEWYPQGKQNILPGQMTETLVTNLRPWTVYHLRVFAENQLGKSKDGKVLQVKTFFVIQIAPFCALFTEKGHFLSTVCYWRWKTWRTSEKRPNHGTDLHQFRGHLGRSGSEAETWDHYKIQSRIQGIQVSQYWLHFQVWWQRRIGYTFRKCPSLF